MLSDADLELADEDAREVLKDCVLLILDKMDVKLRQEKPLEETLPLVMGSAPEIFKVSAEQLAIKMEQRMEAKRAAEGWELGEGIIWGIAYSKAMSIRFLELSRSPDFIQGLYRKYYREVLH